MQSSVEQKWLIKSDNKILGPFTFEQIEELIKKKQITLIDEVRDMNTRWNYIRETQDLKPIVENIRIELSTSEDLTKTIQTKTHQSGSHTLTKTEELSSQEKTPANSKINIELDSSAQAIHLQDIQTQAQVIEFTEVTSDSKMSLKENLGKLNTSKQYVFESDSKIQNHLKHRKKILYLSILGVFILLSIGLLSGYYYKQAQQKKHDIAQVSLMKRYYTLGLDSLAIETYSKMSHELQMFVIRDIIPLIPKLDSAGLINGSVMINEFKSDPQLTDSKRALLEVITLQQSLSEQNLKSAEEALIRAKGFDPTSESIKENEAIIQFLKNKYELSAEIFYDLYKKNGTGRLLYGYILSTLLSSDEKNSEELLRLNLEIDRFVAVKIDFRKELLILSMYINKKIAKEVDFSDSYKKYIETPAHISNLFKIPLTVYEPFYSFKLVNEFIEKLKSYLTVDQKFVIEYLAKIESNDLMSAQNLYSQFENTIVNKESKVDLQIALLFEQKNFDAILALEKTLTADQNLGYGSQYLLILTKKIKGMSASDLRKHVDFLKNNKNVLSLWAELQMIDSKPAQENFVRINSALYNDFIPFQEVKGRVE